MAHVRITTCRPGGKVVDCLVEIRNDQHVEEALARAWSAVWGARCVAREIGEGEDPPRSCVTLRAYEGPRVRPGDVAGAAAVEAARVVGRFEVRRRDRPRRGNGWFGVDGALGGAG